MLPPTWAIAAQRLSGPSARALAELRSRHSALGAVRPALLLQALTLPMAAQHTATEHSVRGRLEFLGDAILGASLAAFLCADSGRAREGALTARRNRMRSNRALREVSGREGLDCARLIRGREGERDKDGECGGERERERVRPRADGEEKSGC